MDNEQPLEENEPQGTHPQGLVEGREVGVGRFILQRKLARGGMGEVWLAYDNQMQDEVALKFLPMEIQADSAALDDLRKEVNHNRKLSHPNIVRVHDFHLWENEPAFFSMEYVDGCSLAKLQSQYPGNVFPWNDLAPYVKDLCAALEYAHEEKIIHRDLKPGNLMVDRRGRLKLADFGIARVVTDSVSRVTMSQQTSGTLPYMSPQQCDGKPAQRADDVYSLGATIYHLLTSKPPFYTGDISYQIHNINPPAISERLAELEIPNEVPPEVEKLVASCLAKEPLIRPQTAAVVAQRLGLEHAENRVPPAIPPGGGHGPSHGLPDLPPGHRKRPLCPSPPRLRSSKLHPLSRRRWLIPTLPPIMKFCHPLLKLLPHSGLSGLAQQAWFFFFPL